MEPWPRLPREAVESPSLEIFKTHLDAVLHSLLWVTLLGQGVGLGDPQRALPTPNILWFAIHAGQSDGRSKCQPQRSLGARLAGKVNEFPCYLTCVFVESVLFTFYSLWTPKYFQARLRFSITELKPVTVVYVPLLSSADALEGRSPTPPL